MIEEWNRINRHDATRYDLHAGCHATAEKLDLVLDPARITQHVCTMNRLQS
jgi:hypothetical protein